SAATLPRIAATKLILWSLGICLTFYVSLFARAGHRGPQRRESTKEPHFVPGHGLLNAATE
ncbi:hypothetical protein ABT124_51675, partial [Streptomyces sp. NPDC001982]|uniref:hypothetical protein n=1 Tax=Streptomyces sp. NPDC001982 TaxID=3154405 RepID=UPI0033189893